MNPLDWYFTVEAFGSQYPLPQHDVKARPKKLALETARAAAATSPYQPVPEGKLSSVQDAAGFGTYPEFLKRPRAFQPKKYPTGEGAIAFARANSTFDEQAHNRG